MKIKNLFFRFSPLIYPEIFQFKCLQYRPKDFCLLKLFNIMSIVKCSNKTSAVKLNIFPPLINLQQKTPTVVDSVNEYLRFY